MSERSDSSFDGKSRRHSGQASALFMRRPGQLAFCNRVKVWLGLILIAGHAGAGGGALVLPRDINPGDEGAYPQFITDAGGAVFFRAGVTMESGSGGSFTDYRLWVSDGTEEGTMQMGNIARSPDHLTRVGGTVFFFGRVRPRQGALA